MYNLIELMEIEQNYIYFFQCIDGCGEIIFLQSFVLKYIVWGNDMHAYDQIEILYHWVAHVYMCLS